MLTLDVLRRMWPHGNMRVPGLVEGIAASAPAVFAKYELNSNLVVAHALSQFSHECGAGAEMVENLNYSQSGLVKTWPSRFDSARAAAFAHQPEKIANAVYNGRMGNRIGTEDGWNYRGRGLSQTTGREAYGKLADKLGLDLLGRPELVNDPQHALEVGVADFVMCGCLPFAQADNITMVTRRLNGGLIGFSERKQWLAQWKRALFVQ